MGVENTLATQVSNLDADPRVMNENIAHGGRLHMISSTVAVAAADDDTSTYRVARLKSTWSIKHIWIYNDAITGGTDYDVGLYDIAAVNAGAVVDADAYTNTIDLSSARTTAPADAAFGTRNITAVNQRVWEDAGLSERVDKFYDLVLTANTVGSGAGDITVVVEYAAGD